jgi:hypothetical protein
MIRLVIVASLLASCRISLEDNDTGGNGTDRVCTVNMSSPSCLEAEQDNHSDLAWIESKIFTASCNFSGCHSSANDLGKLDLRPGMSHDHLVGVSSLLDPTRKLVVPNDVNSSYLMLMLQDVPPKMATPAGVLPSVGPMPQGGTTLCCQKLDVLERWIMAGAPSL